MKSTAESLSSPWISTDLNRWEALIKDGLVMEAPKRVFLYQQGEKANALYIVKSGRVRITSYQSDGSEKQLYIAEQGAMFGESCLMEGHVHTCSALAIVDSSLYRIPVAQAIKAAQEDFDLSLKIMRVMQRKYHILFKQIIELSFNQSRQRFAILLINLAKQYGVQNSVGIRIDLRFTHSDIASMINTSRVNVCNIINDFLKEGILVKYNGRMTIRDFNRLRDLSEGL